MGTVVYRDATIFDGTGAAPVGGRSLVVDGDRIAQVVATDDLVVPDGAEVVELAGRFVIPGLIDSHQHLATPPDRVQAEAWLRRMVYGGVTAIRDMADDLRQIADLARACLVGEIPGPDIHYAALVAGPSFFDDPRTWQVSQGETPGTVPWMQAITDETDLVIATALARGTHASALKIYADLSPELVAAITAEAHRQGVPAWAHASVFPALPLDVVRSGVDVVSHVTMLAWQTQVDGAPTYKTKTPIDPDTIDPDDPRIAEVLAAMLEHGTILDATASMWEGDEVLGEAEGDPAALARAHGNARLSAALTARAFAAGVPVSAGSDYETAADDPFPALHRELYFLHERCGMPAADVLLSATQIGARSAGAGDDLGTLEPGKVASFVVLDRDPVADLRNLASVWCTVKRGVQHLRTDYCADDKGAGS
jgi:imidazolonepropionase-like amidohydrolase